MSLPQIEMKKLLKIVTALQTFTNKLTEHKLMHTKKRPQVNGPIPKTDAAIR
jgi:hypothetical protein